MNSGLSFLRQCKDFHDYCPRWAELGECNKNSAYMDIYCRKSCHCKKDCKDQVCTWRKNMICLSGKGNFLLTYLALSVSFFPSTNTARPGRRRDTARTRGGRST